jgi:hypothetical protein
LASLQIPPLLACHRHLPYPHTVKCLKG